MQGRDKRQMEGDSTPYERIEDLERWRDEIEARWKATFPNGDHLGHCSYHLLMIEDIRDRKALIKAVKEKTIGALVWAAMFGIGLACWHFLIAAVRGA